jgi:hypothetical protein
MTIFGERRPAASHTTRDVYVRIFRSGEVLKGWTGFAVAALKVSRAFGAVVPNVRPLRLLILELGLAVRAKALRLGIARAAYKPDVAHGSVAAEMASDGEIVHDADGG